jgi:mRNA (2'-O-methyladenosine-N6-)-methyltransferase
MALVEHRAFLNSILERQSSRRWTIDPAHTLPPAPRLSSASSGFLDEAESSAGPSKANVINYVGEEETVRNDYAAWYGVSGEWGSNAVLGARDEEICEE